jgi:hypothetical protein
MLRILLLGEEALVSEDEVDVLVDDGAELLPPPP